MKTAFFSGDFQKASREPATLESALVHVADIAAELERYGGKLNEFAYSMERLDQWAAEAFRNSTSILAYNVVAGGLSNNEVAQVHAALEFVCSKDDYAAKQVAPWFLPAVRRVRAIRAIMSHPRGDRFYELRCAIEKGKFTKAQWALAVKLAGEVGVNVSTKVAA